MITLLQESSNNNEQQIMSYSVKLFEEFSEDKLVLYYPNAIAKNTFFIK